MKTKTDPQRENHRQGNLKDHSIGKARLRLFAGAILLFGASLSAAFAAQTDFCRATVNNVMTSCQVGAQSDYSLALGKCDNLPDPAARQACRKQANVDLKDALQTCADQRAVRQAACARLGGAPYDPPISPSNFVAGVNNPFFPLVPGTTFIYEGQTSEGFEHDEFNVTHKTRVIMGVTCIEVHDTVKHDGVLTEDTLDWFAQDRDGNVWYFGENTHELVDGLISTIDGTFMAGVDGAKPGIIMKAHPMIGDFYLQEFSLQNAEDMAEAVSLTESINVPAGSFTSCLKTRETTPLETDLVEFKFYAPNVGNILTVDANTGEMTALVQITTE